MTRLTIFRISVPASRNRARRAGLAVGEPSLLRHQFGLTEDAGQRCPQLVTHRREQSHALVIGGAGSRLDLIDAAA